MRAGESRFRWDYISLGLETVQPLSELRSHGGGKQKALASGESTHEIAHADQGITGLQLA